MQLSSRHNYNITIFQWDILFKLFAILNIAVPKLNRPGFTTGSANDLDTVIFSKGCQTTGKTESLQHIDGAHQRESARAIDLAYDINFATGGTFQDDGNARLRNIRTQPRTEVGLQLSQRQAFCLDLTHQRESECSIRCNGYLP